MGKLITMNGNRTFVWNQTNKELTHLYKIGGRIVILRNVK